MGETVVDFFSGLKFSQFMRVSFTMRRENKQGAAMHTQRVYRLLLKVGQNELSLR